MNKSGKVSTLILTAKGHKNASRINIDTKNLLSNPIHSTKNGSKGVDNLPTCGIMQYVFHLNKNGIARSSQYVEDKGKEYDRIEERNR
jgi:hypothetical protein